MNTKFLYFQGGVNTVGAFPVDKLLCMHETGHNTVELNFQGRVGDTSSPTNDAVTLTVTSGKGKEVIKAIAEKINEVDGPRTENFIVVADEVAAEFLTPDISGTVSIAEG